MKSRLGIAVMSVITFAALAPFAMATNGPPSDQKAGIGEFAKCKHPTHVSIRPIITAVDTWRLIEISPNEATPPRLTHSVLKGSECDESISLIGNIDLNDPGRIARRGLPTDTSQSYRSPSAKNYSVSKHFAPDPDKDNADPGTVNPATSFG